jgi:hypothetical protein
LVNPMTYAVDGLRSIMIKGTSLVNVLPDVMVVGVFALLTQLLGNLALYMSLSGKKIRRRHGKKKTTENTGTKQESPTIPSEHGDSSPQSNTPAGSSPIQPDAPQT